MPNAKPRKVNFAGFLFFAFGIWLQAFGGYANIPPMKLKKFKNPVKATRSVIREKAISRAQTRILLAGRQSSEFSESELETIVKEEEDKLYNTIKEKGLLAALALLGINLFF